MVQSAIVKKQIKEGVVEVSLLRQVECGLSCSGNCAGCMQKPQGELLALASDPIGTKPGERVEVEPSAGHSIGLSALVFGVPCIFLALGYLAGMALGLGEGASVGTAAVGLLVGFLPAVWVNRRITRSQKPEFVILRHQA
ncbi:SoxR reducing system RseC family protein [Pseudoflavonifractor capillosus]|uniref:SoxR reducing system RseC family protein n=1 Tax=Pseudoflavonifractor capillosus TaxID=106588 RepID=UPI00195E2616|nr:SoxR reducing system RseC family protein [Pseudoflavonifractor capillosus]MBM6680659.1 SoxR reducing system RseC family protein [Pseudoflavonifractor capillosus]MBS6349050.1 SoxR reducing system RseC family protein [Oscillospiraceae bacterium]